MKSLFSKYIWLQLILSILLLFAGSLIIAFAIIDKNILEDGLNIIVAVILFLFGLFTIVASLTSGQDKVFTSDLLYAAGCIAFGVFLLMKDFIVLNYLVMLLAIFFIVLGTIELINGIILVVKKHKAMAAIIITFVVAALFIAGGILAIIFRDKIKTVVSIVAGVLVFAAGVYLLIVGIKALIAANKNKETKKPARKKGNKKEEEIKELDYTENSQKQEVVEEKK